MNINVIHKAGDRLITLNSGYIKGMKTIMDHYEMGLITIEELFKSHAKVYAEYRTHKDRINSEVIAEIGICPKELKGAFKMLGL